MQFTHKEKRPTLSFLFLFFFESDMCIGLTRSSPSRRCNPVQIQRLNRRRLSKKAKVEKRRKKMVERRTMMVFKNLELYLENQNIIHENNKLREKAELLIKENNTMFSQLHSLSDKHQCPSQ